MDPKSPRRSGPEVGEVAPEAGGTSSAEPGCESFYTARDWKHTRRFLVWTLAAALAYLGATSALRWRESVPGALPWLLVGVAWLLAIQAIRSYLAFLRGADELLRKIETEGLAWGFGAGAVLSLLYPLLERLGAPRLDGNATALAMMVTWSVGSWLGTRRYSGRGTP